MDRISLKGIQVFGYHGVLAAEKELGQNFNVTVHLLGDFSSAAMGDNLEEAINYAEVHQLVCDSLKNEKFNLIEKMAGTLCEVLLRETTAESVEVMVEKIHPPIPGFKGQAAVTLIRNRQWFLSLDQG
ncbi:MAG: dihydroneopterin aldolase [bacterium]|nr:dihydroneopterin aldolase [bacterium]